MVKKEEKKETVKKEKKEKAVVKKPIKKNRVEKKPKKEDVSLKEVSNNGDGSYFQAVGRRKTSVAVVRIFTKGKKEFMVNNKPYDIYFPTPELQESCTAALKKMKCFDSFRITVNVNGGGINSQMEAVRHGISRALVFFNPDFKKRLRKAGYLTRDPRRRERKKPGLKRARRAPQWRKR
jgi:small subunit ribosomal protein S9